LTDNTAAKIFTFNTNNSEWYGPWTIDSQGMEIVELASPVIEVMMHCGDDGKTLFTDQLSKSDDGAAIDTIIETAFFNGRSMDPVLSGHQKTWKRVRVYVAPRGNWDLKCFWKVDAGFYEDADTNDKDQNQSMLVYPEVRPLTEEFKLGADPDGRLHSLEEMGYFEFRPGLRGYNLALKFQQDGNGQDFAVQGLEIDFVPHGYETE